MDLKDMILVTENDRGTETNMLMALDDYKSCLLYTSDAADE